MPKKVDFFSAEHGVCYSAVRRMPDGRDYDRVSSYLLPNLMSVPPTMDLRERRSVGVSWVVPVDDTHYVQVMLEKAGEGSRPDHGRPAAPRKAWGGMTEADRHALRAYYEAQA